MLAYMSDDIGRLGDAVRRRRAQLGISQVELWRAGGPSNSVLTNIESGRTVPVHPKTLRKLDAGLGWTAGTSYNVLHGHNGTADRADSADRAAEIDDDRAHTSLTDGFGSPLAQVPATLSTTLRYDAERARRALVLFGERQIDLASFAARVDRLVDTALRVAQATQQPNRY